MNLKRLSIRINIDSLYIYSCTGGYLRGNLFTVINVATSTLCIHSALTLDLGYIFNQH